jgi:hypothetical protein
MPNSRTPPSQTWRTFLTNHLRDLVALDFFTVSTVRMRVLRLVLGACAAPGAAVMPGTR